MTNFRVALFILLVTSILLSWFTLELYVGSLIVGITPILILATSVIIVFGLFLSYKILRGSEDPIFKNKLVALLIVNILIVNTPLTYFFTTSIFRELQAVSDKDLGLESATIPELKTYKFCVYPSNRYDEELILGLQTDIAMPDKLRDAVNKLSNAPYIFAVADINTWTEANVYLSSLNEGGIYSGGFFLNHKDGPDRFAKKGYESLNHLIHSEKVILGFYDSHGVPKNPYYNSYFDSLDMIARENFATITIPEDILTILKAYANHKLLEKQYCTEKLLLQL